GCEAEKCCVPEQECSGIADTKAECERSGHHCHDPDGGSSTERGAFKAGEKTDGGGRFGDGDPSITMPRNAQLLGGLHLPLLAEELRDGCAPKDEREDCGEQIGNQHHWGLLIPG